MPSSSKVCIQMATYMTARCTVCVFRWQSTWTRQTKERQETGGRCQEQGSCWQNGQQGSWVGATEAERCRHYEREAEESGWKEIDRSLVLVVHFWLFMHWQVSAHWLFHIYSPISLCVLFVHFVLVCWIRNIIIMTPLIRADWIFSRSPVLVGSKVKKMSTHQRTQQFCCVCRSTS